MDILVQSEIHFDIDLCEKESVEMIQFFSREIQTLPIPAKSAIRPR